RKKRDAYIEKLNTKSAYKNRQGRKNNANDAPQDQASAERRLTMMKRIKNRRK
ncbi:ATP-dependent helicase, partial [Vibrio sp. 10N.261.45.A7]